MKLIKQTVLIFAEGRSEKVYEVDLCEVGANQFVVNFRYGKRGAALKDGSKTAMPVARAEADRVFDKLVRQKTEQGYLPEGAPRPARPVAPAAAPPPPPPGTMPASHDPRAQKILERLGRGAGDRRWFRRSEAAPEWKLERAIWRAGELRIREVEPLLLPLVGTATGDRGLRDYCIAWALGRCGSAASVSTLGRLYGDTKAPEHVRRVAAEALLALSDAETRREFASDMIGDLPEALRAPARGEGAESEALAAAAFTTALATHLRGADANAFAILDKLYLIDSPTVRPAVLATLEAPLKAPTFQRMRHIFKSAEYRRDAQVFGRLAYRFEKERANTQDWDARRRGVPLAFGKATRLYLRRRVARTMRRMGQAGDPAFVPMAVGVLLPFTDADAVAPRTGFSGAASRRVHWGPFAPYLAFNFLLYANSPRFELPRAAKVWRLKSGVRLDAPPPEVREEAFPALWEQNPAGLMHLCAESACLQVHQFAARALRACRRFCDELDLDDVIVLLGRPYEPTARLGFEIAERRYDERRPDPALLLAVAQAAYAPAREKAFSWIDAQRVHLLGDSGFLAGLVLSKHADTRAFARRLLRSSTLPAEIGQALLGRVVAGLLALDKGDEATAIEAAQTVVTALGAHLGTVRVQVLRDLIAHPLQGVQELGAELLLRHDSRTGLVPDDIILGVLHSSFESVRALGMRLIAELPDEVLVAVERLLVRLTTDKNADIRNAARPIVQRIAKSHPEAAEILAQQLVDALLRRLLAEGVPSYVLAVLRDDLMPALAKLPREAVWRLLQSESPHAQELGGVLLGSRLDASDLSLDQIVQLASHEILSVRQASWSMLERDTERVRAELPEAVRVLDAKWPDSRQWAMKFFRERFPPEAFTVEVVTVIVDSVREDVQAFGREMIQRSFREEEGPELLRRLSEHPARSVQLFTTNYLERFATGQPEKLESLVPYFSGVLSRVNQGRVAKTRVLNFLRNEGQKDELSARIVIPLLHRLSATIAIEDRGAALETMVAIYQAQPTVPVPLKFKAPDFRGPAGTRGVA